MAKFSPTLAPSHREFIAAQHIYFTASAPDDGRVNLSPKGMDTFRVLSPTRVGYLDVTGSGNETSAHVRENARLTLMFCALSGGPLILRIYCRGRIVHPRDDEWTQLRPLFGAALPGERQLVIGEVENVQTSCGFGVPRFEYLGDRDTLNEWALKKGPDGIAAYWTEKNQRSIDGLPTGLLENAPDVP